MVLPSRSKTICVVSALADNHPTASNPANEKRQARLEKRRRPSLIRTLGRFNSQVPRVAELTGGGCAGASLLALTYPYVSRISTRTPRRPTQDFYPAGSELHLRAKTGTSSAAARSRCAGAGA